MTDFTPTADQVCDAYVRAMRNAFIASAGEHPAEFDRWFKREITAARQHGYATRLADEQHGIEAGCDWIRGIRADAWDEGANVAWRQFGEKWNAEYPIGQTVDLNENPYRRQENDDE